MTQTSVQVDCNGHKSVLFKTAPRGYPQGSVASPGSFLILMRKAHNNQFERTTYSFADDTTFTGCADSCNQLQENLQRWTDDFEAFCNDMNIKLNGKKTQLCHLNVGFDSKHDRPVEIVIQGETIESVTKFNLLGCILNEKLNFKDHWLNCHKKMKQKGGEIARVCRNFSLKFNRDLVTSFLHGVTGHCIEYTTLPDKNDSSKLNARVNEILRIRFTTAEERQDRITQRRVKQHLLLGRANLLSIENQSRLRRLSRLNKIAMTGLPAKEFAKLISCFETQKENRTNKGIPLLTYKPRCNENKNPRILECQPFDSIRELNKLPLQIKMKFGTIEFERCLKNMFYGLCQHTERNNFLCSQCGVATGTFRSDIVQSDDLKKMLHGGNQIEKWAGDQNRMKPETVTTDPANLEKTRRKLNGAIMNHPHKFLALCRRVGFWSTPAEG